MLYWILIAKNFERIGDLATNIAEDVVYIYSGKIIKHHYLEKQK
jgi:phosphate transport system protein